MDDKIILEALENNATSDGFTVPLKGELKRFIVALTDNVNPNIGLLLAQANSFSMLENVNIGGWINSVDNIKYIDISTSFDNIEQALVVGKVFGQKAIFDIEKFEEIVL